MRIKEQIIQEEIIKTKGGNGFEHNDQLWKATGNLVPETINRCLWTKWNQSTSDICIKCVFRWWHIKNESLSSHKLCSHTHSLPCHVSFQMTEDEVCGNRRERACVWSRREVVGCMCVWGGCHWGKPTLGWGFCGTPPDTALSKTQKAGNSPRRVWSNKGSICWLWRNFHSNSCQIIGRAQCSVCVCARMYATVWLELFANFAANLYLVSQMTNCIHTLQWHKMVCQFFAI